jgi:hypothetical protein
MTMFSAYAAAAMLNWTLNTVGDVAAWPVQTWDEASFDRIVAGRDPRRALWPAVM